MTKERFIEIRAIFYSLIDGEERMREYLLAIDRIIQTEINRSDILFNKRDAGMDAIIKKHTDAMKEEVGIYYQQYLSTIEKQFAEL